MRKFALAIAALLSLSSAACAAFAIFQTASGNVPAVTTCDITTGACTGQGAGTGLFTAATCNGVANDAAAFISFNTWAQASLTNTNGQLLELFIPSGKTCRWTTGSVNTNLVMTGIKNGRISGYGATFQNPTGAGFRLGPATAPGGICQRGINDAAGCSARINTVSAGATAVTINTTDYSGSLSTLCLRFVTGQWAVVTGFDLQGGFGSFQGEPPNPHFFDFVQIGSTAGCAGSGVIQINSALTNGYLSTWPNWSVGNGLGSDKGGPGTIYALPSDWGGSVDIRGLTIEAPNDQTIVHGRTVSLRDVTMTGAHCVIPSQNDSFTMISSTGTGCAIEVDKIINSLNYSGTTLDRLGFQSSSINTLNWNGGSLITDLNGTPKVAHISNLTTPIIRLGPYAYGTPTSADCTNCVYTSAIAGFGLLEKGGFNDPGANIFYGVSGGVFSYPMWSGTVTAFANNGSGKVRITVPSTTGFVSGLTYGISGTNSTAAGGFAAGLSLFATCGGTSPCNGLTVIGNVTATTVDLTDYNFADVTWSGGGYIKSPNSAEQTRWAIPGTNVFATGQLGNATSAFQVTGVTQSGNFVNIATTLAGAYPTVPLSSGKSFLQVQAPKWTCTNCTGNAQAVDFSGAAPNIPFGSYSNRTWTNTPSVTPLVAVNTIGKVTSITVTVSTAYTGATTPLKFNMPAPVSFGSTQTFWNPLFDLRTAGTRVITPSGVTCNGVPGTGCGADSALALPDPATVFNSTMTPAMSGGAPTDANWTISAVFVMDQGVVP